MAGNLAKVAIIQGDRTIATPLDVSDDGISDHIKPVVINASTRWLKNEEVLSLLENFQIDGFVWPKEAAERPEGGKLFVFNRKLCRAFRSDKHNWRKKNDGRTVKETHEKLKVGDRERLNCYYAHAEDSDGLQRRCYWILESSKEDVVLVHYLCSTTSRAGPRGTAAAAAAGIAAEQAGARNGGGATGVAAAVASRPRRAAAQRTRYAKYGDYDIDSDEEDSDQANLRRRSREGDREQQQQQQDDDGTAAVEAAVHVGHQNPGHNFPTGLEFSSIELLDTNILGRFDSKIEGIPDLSVGANLPSLAEQDAAARNAGRGLNDFLIHPTARGAAGASGRGGGGDIGVGTGAPLPFSHSLRRLAHDMMGSGNESLLLQTNMSLGIVDTQDGVPGDLHHLSSPTSDTSGMFGGGGGARSGSPDSKMKLRADLGLGGPSGRPPVISGEPIVLESFIVGTVGREVGGGIGNRGGGGAVEDVSGQLATGMSLEMDDSRRLHRLGSSFGGNALLGSIELGGNGGGSGGGGGGARENGNATAARAAAEIVDKDYQKQPMEGIKSTLHHQESSVATKAAAAEDTSAKQKVETLRRLVAPGFRQKCLADSGSLADMARRTGGSDEDAGAVAGTGLTSSGGRHQRKNPTAAPPPLSGHERVAAAAAAATAVTAEHREERLHQLRQARQAAVAIGTTNNNEEEEDDDEDQLIETNPNPLFRLTSHVVPASAEDLQALAGTGNDGTAVGDVAANAANAAAAEEATTLMKEMSIDQTGMAEAAAAAASGGFDAETVADAGLLMRNMSIDERTTPVHGEEEGKEDTGQAAAERVRQPVVNAATPSGAPKNAFGSDQEVTTPSTTATGTSHEHEPAGRDPSLSSLLDVNHQQQRASSSAVPGGGTGAAGGAAVTAEGSEDVLLAAFAVHRSRAAAKAAGIKK